MSASRQSWTVFGPEDIEAWIIHAAKVHRGRSIGQAACGFQDHRTREMKICFL